MIISNPLEITIYLIISDIIISSNHFFTLKLFFFLSY